LKRYEVVVIVKSDLTEEDITTLIDRYSAIITDRKGVIAKVDKWGKRRLAYEINKQKDGFYFLIDFAGDGPIVSELERNFKIDDRLLKFMTVKKDGATTRETIDAEFAAAEVKRTQIRIESDNSGAAREEKPSSDAKPQRISIKKVTKEEPPAKGE
jgi:small subunit ribosomal protein S6